MNESLAIIAGSGSFPIYIANEARRQGIRTFGIGLSGWADARFSQSVDSYEEASVGQVGRIMDILKKHQAKQAVMAGKVTKRVLWDPAFKFDSEALFLLAKSKNLSVDEILGAMAKRLEKDGIKLLDSSVFLKNNLCPSGVLTKKKPSKKEKQDIEVGAKVARQLASMDVGQTVVVKGKVIVAVEATEGTDEAIKRAGNLSRGELVAVKVASMKQDMRFDIPVVGPNTLLVSKEAGVGCIALEEGKTLLLDKTELIKEADSSGICIVGIKP
jgi:hypothetical protein